MANIEQPKSPVTQQNLLIAKNAKVEKLAREHKEDIERISQLKLPADQLAQIILVLLGEQPAVDIFVYPRQESLKKIGQILQKAGLLYKSAKFDDHRRGKLNIFYIAKTVGLVDQLAKVTPMSGKRLEHEKYARLMGFPQTAIDAFLGRTAKREEYISDNSIIFGMVLSQAHAQEETAYLRRLSLVIKRYAPELYEKIWKSQNDVREAYDKREQNRDKGEN